ncbi:hypothetical protein ACP70R_045278 [Stipagrostis hirtigluma subsp. patula]
MLSLLRRPAGGGIGWPGVTRTVPLKSDAAQLHGFSFEWCRQRPRLFVPLLGGDTEEITISMRETCAISNALSLKGCKPSNSGQLSCHEGLKV